MVLNCHTLPGICLVVLLWKALGKLDIPDKFPEDDHSLRSVFADAFGFVNFNTVNITGHSLAGAIAGQLAQMTEGMFAHRNKLKSRIRRCNKKGIPNVFP